MLISAMAVISASVLAVAGAQKVLDPSMTVGALRALHLPHGTVLVQCGAAAELAVGVGAFVNGGRILWGIVGLSYLGFAAFVLVALRRGTVLGSCGCFGREDVPPHWTHVALNLGAAAGAGAAALIGDVPWDSRPDALWAWAAAIVALATGVLLTWAAFVELPRVLRGTAALRHVAFAAGPAAFEQTRTMQ